jgi:hypothetical protein
LQDNSEFIIVTIRKIADLLIYHLSKFSRGFPHLAKNLYGLCSKITDTEAVARTITDTACERGLFFGLAAMLEDYLLDSRSVPKILNALFTHSNAIDITKAKILEIADQRYGLPAMREAYLRRGAIRLASLGFCRMITGNEEIASKLSAWLL